MDIKLSVTIKIWKKNILTKQNIYKNGKIYKYLLSCFGIKNIIYSINNVLLKLRN